MSAVVQGDERVITLADAIREGITESFAKDDSTFLFAQGVSDPSSMWGTLKGIGNRFGEDRVIEMPIAENGAVGIAIGAAIAGQRPIISFHRVEFVHQQWAAQGALGHSHGDRARLGARP